MAGKAEVGGWRHKSSQSSDLQQGLPRELPQLPELPEPHHARRNWEQPSSHLISSSFRAPLGLGVTETSSLGTGLAV